MSAKRSPVNESSAKEIVLETLKPGLSNEVTQKGSPNRASLDRIELALLPEEFRATRQEVNCSSIWTPARFVVPIVAARDGSPWGAESGHHTEGRFWFAGPILRGFKNNPTAIRREVRLGILSRPNRKRAAAPSFLPGGTADAGTSQIPIAGSSSLALRDTSRDWPSEDHRKHKLICFLTASAAPHCAAFDLADRARSLDPVGA